MNFDREFLGVVAISFIIISIITKDIKNKYSINMIGALLFLAYGIWIESFSIMILNSILVIINVFHLIKKEEK